jgi:ZF-HD class homeobox domain-containing protein
MEKEIRAPGSLSYGHLIGEPPGVERRDATTSRSQQQAVLEQGSDPVTGATTITPAGSGRSNLKAQLSSAAGAVRYRECLRNHAASVGGSVFDGCGEFMPSGEEGTLEALKCAACECHRNFHRREVHGEAQLISPGSRRSMMLRPLQLPPPLLHHQRFSMGPTAAPIVQPMSVAYGVISGGTESSSEDLNIFESNAEAALTPPFALSKKRFRTKFTPEQKDKMMEFAEKVGWRVQKQDEEEVEKFCAEVGVKRQVLKVWMHNNKNTMKKQNETQTQPFEMGIETEV